MRISTKSNNSKRQTINKEYLISLRKVNEKIDNSNNEENRKLRDIFKYYCQFGNKLHENHMKFSNFMKFSEESKILSKINYQKLEIIYTKSIIMNKNKGNIYEKKISFQDFLYLITKISEAYIENDGVDYNFNEKIMKMKEFISEIILNIYKNEEVSNYFKHNLNKYSITHLIEVHTLNTLSSSFNFLYELYKIYFKSEKSLVSDYSLLADDSKRSLFLLLKDLDISPGLISKGKCFDIYDHIIDTFSEYEIISLINQKISKTTEKESISIGVYFTLYHFLMYILTISYEIFHKNTYETYFLCQMLQLLYERIEISFGQKNITEKSIKPLPKKILSNEEVFFIKSLSKRDSKCEYEKTIYKSITMVVEYDFILNPVFIEHINWVVLVYIQKIKSIFIYYCEYGDIANQGLMSISKYLKFLKESHMIYNNNLPNNQGILNSELDIFFKKMMLLDTTEYFRKYIDAYEDDIEGESIFSLKYQAFQKKEPFRLSSFNLNNTDNTRVSINSQDLYMRKTRIISKDNLNFRLSHFIIGLDFLFNKEIYISHPVCDDLRNKLKENFLTMFELRLDDLYSKIEYKRSENIYKSNNNIIYNLIKHDSQASDLMRKLPKILWRLYCLYIDNSHQKTTMINISFDDKNIKKNLMSFPYFFKFLQDFEIFPNLISKSKIISLFKEFTKESNNIKLNIFLFSDILCQVSVFCRFSQKEERILFKIIHLLEKLTVSNGINKALEASGIVRNDDVILLKSILNEYPEYLKYVNDKGRNENKKEIVYEDLFIFDKKDN